MNSKEQEIRQGKISVVTEEKPLTLDMQRIIFKYSEKINESVFSITNEYISLIDIDGTFLYVNPSFNNLGYWPRELINKKIFDYVHPDDIQGLYNFFEKSKKRNHTKEPEKSYPCLRYRFISGTDEWKSIESYISILPDNSEVPAFLFISREFLDYNSKTDENSLSTIEWKGKWKEEVEFREKIEEELFKSQQRFKDITYSIADIIWEMDTNGNYTYCSENVINIYGYKAKEIIGNSPRMLLEPGLIKRWEELYKKKIKNKKPIKDTECVVITKNGAKINILSNGIPVFDKKGEVIGYRGVDKDITVWKKAQEENIRLAAFPRESPHPVLSSDTDGNITYSNPAANAILEGLGLETPLNLLPKNHKDLIKSCLKDKKNYNNLEVKVKGHVYSWTYNPISDIKLVHLHSLDITDQKYFEEKLLHDSLHDKLTGLPNRSLFNDELLRAIKTAKRRKDFHYAVLFMDMGRFKGINDSLGHLVGDKVLIEVAKRLSSCLRPEDTAGRFGGDEFTILLNNITDSKDPVRVVERIQNMISMPLLIDKHEIFPSASIGIVISSQDYSTPEELLRDANTAMYRAKAEGLSHHQTFDKSMHEQAVKQLKIESSLKNALERKEFSIFYQPIVSLETGKIVGFEALPRWLHAKYGLYLPEDFIPILEENGGIIKTGEWIIKKACSQLRTWHKKFPENQHLFISINLSAKQFLEPDLVKTITAILEDENIYPGYLNLEINEGILMQNQKKTSSILSELRKMDIQIGIDNFGLGYFSLNHLHNFPIQKLEIDRSFITPMNKEAWSSVLPRTIISLAKHLEMDVVAEGVENENQFRQLKKFDCGYAQGHYFSPPVDSKKAGALLLKDPVWN